MATPAELLEVNSAGAGSAGSKAWRNCVRMTMFNQTKGSAEIQRLSDEVQALKEMHAAEQDKVRQMAQQLQTMSQTLQALCSGAGTTEPTPPRAHRGHKRVRSRPEHPAEQAVQVHHDGLLAKRQRQSGPGHPERAHPGQAAGSKRSGEHLDEEERPKTPCRRPAAARSTRRRQPNRKAKKKSNRK